MAALDAVAAACAALGAIVRPAPVDVTDRAATRAWVEAAEAALPLDLVIANAGVTERTAGVWGDLEAGARVCMEVNYFGVLNTVCPALPPMVGRGRGQICVISSIAGFTQFSAFDGYSASKAAVRYWAEGLRWRLSGAGVRVNVACPGYIEGRMTQAFQGSLNLMGMVSSESAARAIAGGLERDAPLTAFPASTSTISFATGALPFALKDLLARSGLFAEVRYNVPGERGGSATGKLERLAAAAASQ